jgi:hypothetical protein
MRRANAVSGMRLVRFLKYNVVDHHAARGQGSIGLDPVLEIASSGFQQQHKGLTFRAHAIWIGQRVEGQWVDRVPEPAAAVDVAVYEVVSGVGVVDVRRVVSLENGEAKGDRGDQGCRSGVLERAGVVDDVPEGTIRCLERTSVIDRSGRYDRAGG